MSSNESQTISIDTDGIKDWRSIVTLIVFVITNIIVLFPFSLPTPAPQVLRNAWWDLLAKCRIISRRHTGVQAQSWSFPVNLTTAPLIADLFLLAILAIGRDEVYGGTVGTDNIYPIYIMIFFLTLAYIAISIDASGLLRWLSCKVLEKGGKNGRVLFLYLYLFFFILASFVGNDPIVLSGTAFLAYLTRVSSNISEPTAWIFTQFSVANVASAILVSSNPTNLVLAGAFSITFIEYTANMIVPVVVTAILLCPFLMFVVFNNNELIPPQIELHDLPEDRKTREPTNPNIPNARAEKADAAQDEEEARLLSLEEIMNPYLDRTSAIVGSCIMAVTLVAILALNAVADKLPTEFQVYYVTLPAAVVVLCWDLFNGWTHKSDTLSAISKLQAEIDELDEVDEKHSPDVSESELPSKNTSSALSRDVPDARKAEVPEEKVPSDTGTEALKHDKTVNTSTATQEKAQPMSSLTNSESPQALAHAEKGNAQESREPATLQSLLTDAHRWSQVTFPTATTVMSHLPFPLVPFSLCMFVLVQALVSRGWIAVFAYGYDHWIDRTGVVGAIGGMGFLGVVLCNFAGTNIGTTILLCRLVQTWVAIHAQPGAAPISQRTFWATVYSLALGVNYGAFSTAFSASLAGLLWRDILARKDIHVGAGQFAWRNLPIIAFTMVIGLVVLIGEIYLTRTDDPYTSS